MTQLPLQMRRELKRHFTEEIVEITPVRGGSISRAVRLKTAKRSYFLKWNDHGASDQFLAEAAGLEALRLAQRGATSPLLIPLPIGVSAGSAGLDSSAPPYLLMEWIETGRPDSQFDERLGDGLASLHRASAPQFGFDQHTYCGVTKQENRWRERWGEFYAERKLDLS